MGIKAIIATIGYKIKQGIEQEAYKDYVAKCLRILTENTMPIAVYYSDGAYGKCLPNDYADIVNPKPIKELKKGEAIECIRAKFKE